MILYGPDTDIDKKDYETIKKFVGNKPTKIFDSEDVDSDDLRDFDSSIKWGPERETKDGSMINGKTPDGKDVLKWTDDGTMTGGEFTNYFIH
jgi:hypothetical protein